MVQSQEWTLSALEKEELQALRKKVHELTKLNQNLSNIVEEETEKNKLLKQQIRSTEEELERSVTVNQEAQELDKEVQDLKENNSLLKNQLANEKSQVA